MNKPKLEPAEWHFSRLLEDDLRSKYDGLEYEMALALVHSWEFSRELVSEYPMMVECHSKILEEMEWAVDTYPHWKCEAFPRKPWFALDCGLRERLVDDYIDVKLDEPPGVWTMRINLRRSKREIEERIELAKKRFNAVYDETREINEEMNRRLGRDLIRRFEKKEGGRRDKHRIELVALGKERIVNFVGGNREKAKRYYNDETEANDNVLEHEEGDKTFYNSRSLVRDALDKIKDSFPMAYKDRLFQKLPQL
jgi:hypothetical protein